MYLLLIPLLAILALAYLPQTYVQGVIKRYSKERPELGATGAEFARRLLDGQGLGHVKVEATKSGDHYDPDAKVVRLAPERYSGRSLAAVVIAAHEVGHAIQDAKGYRPLSERTKMAKRSAGVDKIAGLIMLASPVLLLISRNPFVMITDYLAGAALMLITIVMHVLTLPVEFDASFGRAMPLLKAEGGLPKADWPAARKILRAAAFTYVAAAAMSLLNVSRWFRLFR